MTCRRVCSVPSRGRGSMVAALPVLAIVLLTSTGASAQSNEVSPVHLSFRLNGPSDQVPDLRKKVIELMHRRAEAMYVDLAVAEARNGDREIDITVPHIGGIVEVMSAPGWVEVSLVDDSTEAYHSLEPIPDGATVESREGLVGAYREIVFKDPAATPALYEQAAKAGIELGMLLPEEGEDEALRFVVLRPTPILTSADIKQAKAVEASDPDFAVAVTLTTAGGQALEGATRDHVGHRLAVRIDGFVVHTPKIREAITGGAIHVTKCSWRTAMSPDALARGYTAVLDAPYPDSLEYLGSRK